MPTTKRIYEIYPYRILQNDTDEPSASLIDNFLQRLLKLLLGILRHAIELAFYTLFNQLVQGPVSYTHLDVYKRQILCNNSTSL